MAEIASVVNPDVPTWSDIFTDLLHGYDLDPLVTTWAMNQIMTDAASAVQMAGFLVAMRAKGETPAEVNGLVEAMLAHAKLIDIPGHAVDVVGTGGDRSNSVNISTMAAIAVAGTGAHVVKHGNRAASSACGSADLLEALGIDLSLTPDAVEAVGRSVGITFCFAPIFHPSMRFVGPTRKELGIPTIFNILGPLSNPAQPTASAVGCGDLRRARLIADVFAHRQSTALVFRGDDGLDEITTTTTTQVWRVHGGTVTEDSLSPQRLGLTPASPTDLLGGDPAVNAAIARDVFAGKTGPVRDVVVANAAAALVALEMSKADAGASWPKLEDAFVEAMDQVRVSLDGGGAASVLQAWVAATVAKA